MSTMAFTEDEAQIRALIGEWQAALAARDLDGMLRHYAAEVVFFDAVPPFVRRGAAAYRESWEGMFQLMPLAVRSEVCAMVVAVSGDLATMHAEQCLVNAETGAPATCGWVRVSVVYQRQAGSWKVIHEHVSVPFDPKSGQAVFARGL